MNINETIFLANFEKCLNAVWQENYNKIFNNSVLEESVQLLNVKYNKTAELLREFNYNNYLHTLLCEKELTSAQVVDFKNVLSEAFECISSSDLEKLEEGYMILSDMYTLCKSGLLESFKKTHKNINDDDQYRKAVEGKATAIALAKERRGESVGTEEYNDLKNQASIMIQDRISRRNAGILKKMAKDNYKIRKSKGNPTADEKLKKDIEGINKYRNEEIAKHQTWK